MSFKRFYCRMGLQSLLDILWY